MQVFLSKYGDGITYSEDFLLALVVDLIKTANFCLLEVK